MGELKEVAPRIIIGVVLALVLIGALLSTALSGIIGFSTTNVTIDSTPTPVATANPTVSTLFSSILPIMAVIGLILMFVPRGNKS